MFSFLQLVEEFEKNKIDYEELKNSLEFNLVNTKEVDVSIIIPVKGRENFNEPLVDYLVSAMEYYSEKTYSITFVEHSEESTHRELCKDKTNHIWIKKTTNQFFNKCLAMNVGALFSNKAKHYLFHDIDLLFTKYFFLNIFENLSRIPTASALQTFAGRRVVVMNKDLTDAIISKQKTIDQVVPGHPISYYSLAGAPGGSIFIDKESFFDLGGFDAEFFHSYSCEDAFFYHKAEVTVGIQGCDNPPIEVFHMEHPRTNGSDNPDKLHQSILNSSFISLPLEDKINFIKLISNNLKNIA